MNLQAVPSPCNICGAERFAAAPNGRTAPSGRASRCQGCGSFEHHRMIRSVFAALPRPLIEGARCVRLARDPALETAWFAELVTVDRSLAGLKSSDCDWLVATQTLVGE